MKMSLCGIPPHWHSLLLLFAVISLSRAQSKTGGGSSVSSSIVSSPASSAATAVFQDEVRVQADRTMPSMRRVMTPDFQDSVWQAGRLGAADEPKNALYREPFALASDEEIHAVLDAAHAQTLARLKEEDSDHDGVLRAHHLRGFVSYSRACAPLREEIVRGVRVLRASIDAAAASAAAAAPALLPLLLPLLFCFSPALLLLPLAVGAVCVVLALLPTHPPSHAVAMGRWARQNGKRTTTLH